MSNDSRLLLWEYEPGVADLTERQQELYQDLAFLVEKAFAPSNSSDGEQDTPQSRSNVPDEKSASVILDQLSPQLRTERARLDHLLQNGKTIQSHLGDAQKELESLMGTLKTVQDKTDALYGDCEDLVSAQNQLVSKADALHARMEPLLDYDRLAVQLNAPAVNVGNEAFLEWLDKLQHNMDYVTANPDFKEAPLYRTRYSQLLSKAAALIRNEVDRSFQRAVAEVMQAVAAGESVHNTFSVLYSVFQQHSGSIRLLLKNIDDRGVQFPAIYNDLVQDCHRLYFASRTKLLDPFVQTSVVDFRRNSKQNITELLRAACSFLARVCREEFRLYYQYFTQPAPMLTEYLAQICQIFYDGIRPEIIHMDLVEKISDVCCFLNQEVLREHSANASQEMAPFVEFVRVLLADCRERLMFRVSNFVLAEIVGFKPNKGDFAYPEKLEILHQLLETSKEESRHRISSRMSVSSMSSRVVEERYLFSVESQGFWYPTLRRAVGFLTKLYQSLDAQSFKIVAQEVIFRTLESLHKAAEELFKAKGRLHCDLFLISHILVLREHLTLFQMDLSTEEDSLDFSRVMGAAKGIVQRKSSIFSLSSRNALLDFFLSSAPDIRTSVIDCRKEVDVQLRNICLRLVDYVTQKVLGPLPEFLDKADVVLSMEKPSSSVKLRNQSFSTATEVKEIVALVYRNVKVELPAMLDQFLLYLISVDTQYVLYKPVRTNIWRNLERMHKLLMEAYNEDDLAMIGWPTLEQWNVMLNIPPPKSAFSRQNSRAESTVSSVQHV
ncbi:conserved oligomeric Golgi complex subunit 3-like [Paramacrobiotus metropolitanus]|uniref:conserved oligomeric Golgi complex subunit 3-like n=1 Tax=Paramacrobiotus metropolitanus TaxID=2943436 RepID=UPI002445A5EA|nr:conserved oligomeric Golgi complex subunit 3-like [Paramacrobiotus metropolitanus]XP_055347318.1 conserved oligomeric Golgi complex subunit 3-like [Paramacrobiotus metropolitanus]